jgi:hypothetical protein
MAPQGASTWKEPAVPPPQIIPARITFVVHDTPDAGRLTFGPVSAYLEFCLLPLIGPGNWWRRSTARPDRDEVSGAGEVGISQARDRTGPFSPPSP